MPQLLSLEAVAPAATRWPRELARLALVALGCALLTYACVHWSPLAGRPIVNASAGLALAAVMLWGRRMAPAVALGTLVAHGLWGSANCPQAGCPVVPGALMHGANEALMALFGAWLLRRWMAQPVQLAEPREVVVFFVGGACLPAALAAGLSSGYHVAFGGISAANLPVAGLGHWVGSTLGVMIAAPMAWAWLGRPRADWAPRRWPLMLTGLLSTALVHVGVAAIAVADSRRTQAEFDRTATHAEALLRVQIQNAMNALQVMQALFSAGREVSRDEFRQVAELWLEPPGPLQAIGWSECLRHADIGAFEARAHAEGLESLHVQSATGDGGVRPPRPGERLVVIRYIEPLAANQRAPGINSMANPAAGAAMDAALRSGRPAATASFPLRLPNLEPGATELGVVVYQAVALAPSAAASGCQPAARGLVFTTLRLSSLWVLAAGSLPAPLTLCVVDRDATGPRRELAGTPGCETAAAVRRRVDALNIGDRQWDLHVLDTDRERGRATDIVAGLSAIGMAGAALLVALLLVVTGRARRIEAAVADAEAARDAAEAATRATSGFLSRMSHELRTPLNAVLGFAQLLETADKPPLPATQRRWVARIHQAGLYLLEMISDVLDLSRIESDTLQLASESLAIDTLIADAVVLVEQRASQRGITIRSERAPDALWVRGDATRVQQILINLLSNAVKYNRERGLIEVHARQAAGRIEIEVRDSGLGMSAEQLAQLFQPFNRLGRERSIVEGTGIGLVICTRLAHLMGGELRVASVAEQGSTFTLLLPAGAPPDPAAPSLPTAPGAAASQSGGRRVHYIEDNPVNVEIVRAALAQRGGIALEHSDTGSEALRRLLAPGARRPDVILLDLHLPDIDGIALLRRLKAEPATLSIPVVMASADAMGASVDEAIAAGAIDYLTKPLDIAQMLRVLDRCFEARSGNVRP